MEKPTFWHTITDHTAPVWISTFKVVLLIKTVLVLVVGHSLAVNYLVHEAVLGFIAFVVMVWLVAFIGHVIDMVILHHLTNVRTLTVTLRRSQKNRESKGSPKRLLDRTHEEA